MPALVTILKSVSSLEHESKCMKVHGISASLSPMKDSCSGSVRYFDGVLTDKNAKWLYCHSHRVYILLTDTCALVLLHTAQSLSAFPRGRGTGLGHT